MRIPNRFNGFVDGHRLYFKGGSTKSAERMEKERQAKIEAAIRAINQIFDSKAASAGREKLYADQRDAVYEINARDVNRQYGDAERNNRFGLARHGLMGGSVDVDSNARLQEISNEGLMKASGIADSAAASLKSKDESAKQNLISLAQSGIDTGTAQQMAIEKLNTTAQEAEGARAGASVGDLFGNLGQAYLKYSNPGSASANMLNTGTQGGSLSIRRSYDGNTSM